MCCSWTVELCSLTRDCFCWCSKQSITFPTPWFSHGMDDFGPLFMGVTNAEGSSFSAKSVCLCPLQWLVDFHVNHLHWTIVTICVYNFNLSTCSLQNKWCQTDCSLLEGTTKGCYQQGFSISPCHCDGNFLNTDWQSLSIENTHLLCISRFHLEASPHIWMRHWWHFLYSEIIVMPGCIVLWVVVLIWLMSSMPKMNDATTKTLIWWMNMYTMCKLKENGPCCLQVISLVKREVTCIGKKRPMSSFWPYLGYCKGFQ